ncbi:MAG: disulfide bond formation protein B [Ilumatobacteraceae bacterium]|nr:MAG: disulfide bond formation protein B [Actinomycetota bacterium]
MDVESFEVFFSVLAFFALAGTVLYVFARLFAGNSAAVAETGRAVQGSSLWLAFLVAATCTVGSLYFSEVANYVPCQLCWYQRIAMYPLSVILLVAAVRRDRRVGWYVVPVATIGLAVAVYHYLIERLPSLGEGACQVGPSCTDVWFETFGFVTLAFMAACGFAAIIALTVIRFPSLSSPLED